MKNSKNDISAAAAMLGKKGGETITKATQKASRVNGKKGGRPSNMLREKAVGIFSAIGHELTSEDFVMTRESIKDFEASIISAELEETETVDGFKTKSFQNVKHSSGKKLNWLVIIDLNEWRAVSIS